MGVPLPIETERLVMRAFRPAADSQPMFAVYGDAEVMRFVPGGALRDVHAVRETLNGHVDAQLAQGFSNWAVVDRLTGEVIGDAGFGIFEQTGEIELGYTLLRERWGSGYGTEAASACLAAGLAHLAATRIIAVIDVANAASLRVAERIGMTKLDEIQAHGRPHIIFAASA